MEHERNIAQGSSNNIMSVDLLNVTTGRPLNPTWNVTDLFAFRGRR